VYLLALPQYASVPDPRQNVEKTGAQSPYYTGDIKRRPKND